MDVIFREQSLSNWLRPNYDSDLNFTISHILILLPFCQQAHTFRNQIHQGISSRTFTSEKYMSDTSVLAVVVNDPGA